MYTQKKTVYNKSKQNVNKWKYEWHDVMSSFKTFSRILLIFFSSSQVNIFSVLYCSLFGVGILQTRYRNLWAKYNIFLPLIFFL